MVSVTDKQTQFHSRLSYTLPTNPSNRDRQQLQRTVASAITGKRMTLMEEYKAMNVPVPTTARKATVSGRSTPMKRRMVEARPAKRVKKYHYR